MTVLQITPGLPPVWGPYKAKPGSRYFTAAGVTPAQAPYLDRLGICLHLVNYSNIGGTAASFHVNHFVPQGDKVSGSGSLYGTCYHGVIGGAGDVVISLDETAGPNSAGTASNARFVHLVMMMGDWTHPDERHERTIEAVAQLCADMCIGFGIPPTWCNVYNERDQTKRLAAAMTLTNPDRHKVGIFGHRDITAAYTTLTRAGLTERAAPFKNTHGDPGNFPPDRLITRVRQIIEERTDDMAQLVTTPGDPAAFEVSGTSARWIPDWDSLLWMWQRKLVAEKVTVIPRADLKRLHLSGPEPVAPSTTKGTEFATWNPAA